MSYIVEVVFVCITSILMILSLIRYFESRNESYKYNYLEMSGIIAANIYLIGLFGLFISILFYFKDSEEGTFIYKLQHFFIDRNKDFTVNNS